MVVVCEKCDTRFHLDDTRVPAKGARVRCSRCKHAFFVQPAGREQADVVDELVADIKNNVRSAKNTIVIVGFQPAHTLGRRLADGDEQIKLFHEKLRVKAEVVQIHGFSGHADQTDLLRLLSPLAGKQKRVFLVHGEEDQSRVFAGKLRETGVTNVTVATRGQRVDL